jgi:O-antigen ligase
MIVFSLLLGFSGRLGEDIDLQIFGLTFTYNSNSIAFAACLSLSFLILDRSLYSGIWVWIFGAILFFALLISGSKKTLFLIICAFIWYGFLGGKSKKIKLTSFVRGAVITSVVILGVYVIVMTVPFFYDIIGIRIEEMFDYYNGGYGDSSTRSRDELVQIGMDNFYDHPLWGVGINNFRSFNNSFYYSHNDYVELLSGVGLIGCIIAYLPKLYILIRVLLELRREYANYIFITSEFFILAYGTVSYYKREDWLVLVIILALLEINKNKKIKHQRTNKYCQ